ncbi:hypothetical protein O3G_MSEX007808 [Manduca sexta]|uniref:Peptidoglycan binding-like domain-containing protein n=1 Tax=Manduca sexta TaxID=7130 RepID=A0A921Z9P9_MANSE|nr:hypothetical protein O3G_MSEX007808 [Manduca sexta]KAG6452792.1 hypothetical protein O3G_MSEX007808 [Manduca sexta]
MANLLMGNSVQSYEDDFRIAIKTLQEFGGIAVTGELDEATKKLMKQKRCGRPDREEWESENGHRKKRFAVQGEKWKYTNLTWSELASHPTPWAPVTTRGPAALCPPPPPAPPSSVHAPQPHKLVGSQNVKRGEASVGYGGARRRVRRAAGCWSSAAATLRYVHVYFPKNFPRR